mmetsp:Transcript_26127/g.56102  ORF Transcript_26127/g.56102 Transcript_26127/m.56102 type:complete len:329 (-) Transcript_26127:2233-3219(-)
MRKYGSSSNTKHLNNKKSTCLKKSNKDIVKSNPARVAAHPHHPAAVTTVGTEKVNGVHHHHQAGTTMAGTAVHGPSPIGPAAAAALAHPENRASLAVVENLARAEVDPVRAVMMATMVIGMVVGAGPAGGAAAAAVLPLRENQARVAEASPESPVEVNLASPAAALLARAMMKDGMVVATGPPFQAGGPSPAAVLALVENLARVAVVREARDPREDTVLPALAGMMVGMVLAVGVMGGMIMEMMTGKDLVIILMDTGIGHPSHGNQALPPPPNRASLSHPRAHPLHRPRLPMDTITTTNTILRRRHPNRSDPIVPRLEYAHPISIKAD